MTTPKVSVIICTYKYMDDLQRAIDSCGSKYIDDIVLVDDGSDNFEYIQLPSRSKNVRMFCHHKNHGSASARNTGIANAKNDWILCLDSDDWLFDGADKLFSEALDEVKVVSPPGYAIYHGNMIVHKMVPGGTVKSRLAAPHQGEITKESLLAGPPCWTTSLFHKSVWNALAGFKVRPEKMHYDDWNFWIRAWLAGFKFKYVHETVFVKTERPSGICLELETAQEYYRKLATEDL
jgi:glycosyltransferase involved in cell wall biosynthesis